MGKMDRRKFLLVSGITPLSMSLAPQNIGAFENSPSDRAVNYDPWLEINLNHIGWNLSQIRKRVQNRPVMGVIKANAYGHGIVEVAKYLEKQNIASLAVGKVLEAIHLRENGVKCPILNFGPFSKEEAAKIVRMNISQTVYTQHVDYLNEAAGRFNRKASVHINVDTGLGRVGIPHNEAVAFLENVSSLDRIHIEGIFTVFTEDTAFDKTQLNRFLKVCNGAKQRGIDIGLRHAASSDGVLTFPGSHLDMVRPGITIYGHYPSTEEYQRRRIDLKPAMALKARVAYRKTLQPGDSVSYHRQFIARDETTVTTVPVGYSDGYPYQIADKGEGIVGGQRQPIIAAITANHTILNITGDQNTEIGDEAVLIGRQGDAEVTAEEVAEWAGTSVYKIVIGMNPLLPRIYLKQ